MAGPGKCINFYEGARATHLDVAEAIGLSRNTAIHALVGLLCQDYAATGVKRAAFRPGAFCPIATDPASLNVRLTPGFCLINNGAELNLDWFTLRSESAQDVLIPVAHGSLTRYDIIYLQPKFTPTGSTAVTFRDPITGNLSTNSVDRYALDDYDLAVQTGDPGAANPSVNRTTAHTLLPAGRIPIAVVTVGPGATAITLDKIQDVRELFQIKQVADDYSEAAAVITQLGDLWPALGLGMAARVTSETGRNNIPVLSIFYDDTDGKFKAKKPNGNIVDFSA